MRKPIRYICSPFVLVLPLLASCFGWQGEFADGTPLTQGQLDRLLAAHYRWLQTADEKLKEEEKKANVEAEIPEYRIRWRKKLLASDWEADKGRLVLKGVNLSLVNLKQADLRKANLYGTNLWKANLQKANLEEANLQATNLREANLQATNLKETNLKNANLEGANLKGIYFSKSNAAIKGPEAEFYPHYEPTIVEIEGIFTYRFNGLFPWPPPLASATEIIPRELLAKKSKTTKLQDIDDKLNAVIKQHGYYESGYYAVPAGFALATRMEQIEPDGTPKKGPQRWSLRNQPLWSLRDRPLGEFSLATYLRLLFFASPGYYRVIVFMVTAVPLRQSPSEPTLEEAKKWLSSGYNRLPDDISKLKFSPAYTCTALIYEFERASESDEPHFRQPGRIPGHDHLVKAGIWASLQQ